MNRDTIVPHVVRVTLFMSICRVTPSRVCELKCELCESRNGKMCHTLTGVCVEIARSQAYGAWWRVTPSRVCTENYDNFQIADLHPLRPKYKAKANHNHILINKNSAETFASAPSIIP